MTCRYAGSAYGPRWFLAETQDGLLARRLWDPTPVGVRAAPLAALVDVGPGGAVARPLGGGPSASGPDPLSALAALERLLAEGGGG